MISFPYSAPFIFFIWLSKKCSCLEKMDISAEVVAKHVWFHRVHWLLTRKTSRTNLILKPQITKWYTQHGTFFFLSCWFETIIRHSWSLWYIKGLEADTQSDKSPGTQDTGVIRRQGSKLSYGSNDSGGSGSSAGAPKVIAWPLYVIYKSSCIVTIFLEKSCSNYFSLLLLRKKFLSALGLHL